MSVVRVGSTQQYSDNWDSIFGGSKAKKSTSKKTATTKKVAKKSTKKKVAKKTTKKKTAKKKKASR